MKPSRRRTPGFTLLELLAAVAIVGLLASVAWVRSTAGQREAKVAGCKSHKGNIEIQAELWRHHTGAWPATNLSDVGASAASFPAGLPTCPVDGTAYTINSTGRVVGHAH